MLSTLFHLILFVAVGLIVYSQLHRVVNTPRYIGTEYLKRWFIIPRNKYFNVYLHRFRSSDDDRACHDHPWWSVSFLLKGRLQEKVEMPIKGEFTTKSIDSTAPIRSITTDQGLFTTIRPVYWLRPLFRKAEHRHQVQLLSKEAWTLFITGSNVREWGFWCSGGTRFVPWQEFTDPSGNHTGAGCGEEE